MLIAYIPLLTELEPSIYLSSYKHPAPTELMKFSFLMELKAVSG